MLVSVLCNSCVITEKVLSFKLNEIIAFGKIGTDDNGLYENTTRTPVRKGLGKLRNTLGKLSSAELEPDNTQIQVSFVVAVQTFPLRPSIFKVDK